MRPLGGIVFAVTALALACPTIAAAASPAAEPTQAAALDKAVFAKHKTPKHAALTSAGAVIAPRSDAAALAAGAGLFESPAVTGTGLDAPRLLAPDRLIAGEGLVQWRNSEVQLPHGAAVDSLRLSLGEVARAPGGQTLAGPGALLEPEAQAFELRYTRGWPSAFAVSAGGVDMDLSPHAGVGLSSGGSSAEAGAMVRLGAHLKDTLVDGLGGLGLRQVSHGNFNGAGRFYFYASASGRAVDLNMSRDAPGDPQHLGWASDGVSSAMISDAQAGMAWRKGAVQASFGYVHREIRNNPAMVSRVDPGKLSDSMVALSFSIRPR
jgi:hypothetical protein